MEEKMKRGKRSQSKQKSRKGQEVLGSNGKKVEGMKALVQRAKQAQAAYDYAIAVELYTQAMASGKVSLEMEYIVRDRRADCFQRLGNYTAELEDLEAMINISQELGEPARQISAVYRLGEVAAKLGMAARAQQVAGSALALAEQVGDLNLKAASLVALGNLDLIHSEAAQAINRCEQALPLLRQVGDQSGEAYCLRVLSRCYSSISNPTQSKKYAEQALVLYRALGDRKGEGLSLNHIALASSDYSFQRVYGEQALAVFQVIDDRGGQGQMYNNLSLLYGHLGLYGTARQYAHRGVQMAREAKSRSEIVLYLESLGRAEMDLGEYAQAQNAFDESCVLAREVSDRIGEGYDRLGMGRSALATGKAEEARQSIQLACDLFREINARAELAAALAWLGAAYLALGDPQKAQRCTAEAVAHLEEIGNASFDYPPQDAWWLHYQVLKHDTRSQPASGKVKSKPEASPHGKAGTGDGSDQAWSVLQRAREITLAGIASLSDEGLRRNYLNKVQINRAIIAEWTRQAAARGLAFEEEATRPGNLQEQLKRLLAIGVRMNEQRDVTTLVDFIMDELIELSGAERALLVLVDGDGDREVAAGRGFAVGQESQALIQVSGLLDTVDRSRQPVLRQDLDELDLDAVANDLLTSLSVLCVPLVSRGQLIGSFYADNHVLYGRFTQADVDLLTAFANQVAAAIENARLYQGLEQRVAERTADLQAVNTTLGQRNAELAVITSVQQGLAAQLDFNAIIELVGEKIRQVFNAQGIGIALYDRRTNTLQHPYYVDDDQRINLGSVPLGTGFTAHIIHTQQALLVNRDLVQKMEQLGSSWIQPENLDTRFSQAYLGVPIIVGGEVIGVISLTNYEQEDAFSASEVDLLSTLASSMSVALENARLFEAERQRSAELSIINSVQQGLAAQLDFQQVIDLVGDKLREVFNTQDIGIRLYDRQTDLIHYAYEYEHGQRLTIPPEAPGGVSRTVIQLRKPLVVNQDIERVMREIGSTLLPGTDLPKSLAAVPILIGEEVNGVIYLDNYEREHAFSESDLRLMSTMASSMSVALKNARLFQETKRLLEETQQRVAELAIINSVQQALAKQLDYQAIIDLVGENIRQIFKADTAYIARYDRQSQLVHFPYYVEKGHRHDLKPYEYGKGLTSKVIESRQTLRLNTVKEWEELGAVFVASPGAERDLNESFLGVPILIGDEVTGVASVQRYEPWAFDDSEVRLLSTLAASLSVSLENARLFEAERQRAAELAIINSVQQALASQLDFQEVINLVGDKLREVLNTQDIGIRLYDRQTKLIHYVYEFEHGQRLTVPPGPPGGFSRTVLKTRKPLVINEDMEQRMAELGASIIPGTDMSKSMVAVPILIGDEATGFIIVDNFEKENAYSDSDVRLMSTMASSMSVALENARLFDETNRLLEESVQKAAELATVNTVSQALTSELELEALIQLIGEQMRQIFNADIVYVAMLDRQTGLIHFPYAYGEEQTPMRFGEGLTSRIIESSQPLLINEDIDRRSEALGTPHVGVESKSYLGVPILVGKQAIGVISVQTVQQEGHFDEDDVHLLTTIAANVGAAIRNAQLYQETERRAGEMAVLSEIGREISATLDLPELLERIATRAEEMLKSRTVTIRLLEPDGSLPTMVAIGRYAEMHRGTTLHLGEGITGNVALKGVAEIVNNPRQDPRMFHVAGTPEDEDVEAIIFAPLMTGESVIGVMGLWRDRDQFGPFSQNDLDFMVGLAHQAAIAIENARLFEEIQRQKQYSEALLQNSPVAIVTADLQGNVVSWNPAAERLFGYSAEEATGIYITDLITTAELREESERNNQQLAGGGKINIVTRRARKDGSLVDVELLGLPVVMDGKQVGLIAIYHDISERKRAEEALQRQKQYLEAVVQNSPVAIVTTDLSADIVSWNPAAEELFGYTSEEAVGCNVDDLVAKNEAIRMQAVAYNTEALQGVLHRITQRVRKDGSLVDVELSGVPVFVDGQPTGLIAIYHDITELQRARQEAEAANDAKSAFLATMSHEIRTPMNGVIGMTSLLLDTELTPEQRDYSETIRNSGEALLAVINDILDFSKIEAGKMDLEEQPFDLRDCVEAALDLLKFKAAEKGLELAYQMEPDVPPAIVGDVTRLRQVLINLLNNGLKFTDQGEVVLSVSNDAVPTRHTGNYLLHFSVRDSGIGIPPDRLDRLFQAFSQVDASTARKYGGTGLGLAISKRLSELMGGEMWVESHVGVGTTFHFTIIAQAAPEMKERPDLRGEQSQLRGKRLLIVDDNSTNRRILTLQTRAWGMQTRDTGDPLEALTWIGHGDPFDLAILDYNMPEMDGLALASEIRKHRSAQVLPLVLFSSLGSRETISEGEEFAAYLMKPFRQSALLDTLMNVLVGQPRQEGVGKEASKPQIDAQMATRLPLRILLVEDNAVNQKLALRLLAQMGYRADVAGNGLEAIQAVERQMYEVILMDVQMPEMDGLEASRRICARWPRGERPHIIAMTANAMQGDRELCLEAGMDDYVSKPIRVEELVSALNRSRVIS